MAVTTNFNKTNMALFYKGLSERGHRILFSKDPNVDSIIGGSSDSARETLIKVEFFLKQGNISSNRRLFHRGTFSLFVFLHPQKESTSHQEEKIKINLNADSVLAYRTNNNLDSTCLKNNRYENSISFKIIGKIRIDKKNLSEINEDSTEENLLNSVKVIEEEEEVDEEEEEEEEEEENEVKDEGKDYEATLVYDSIDDLFYLDNDYPKIYLIHIKTRN
ncbi:LOW QUALITY PROTEIN: myb-like protein X [Vespula squamosa]|uniref:Myb-like protein X n=1 Tax=Vespula squamosa TaxID=30214 RepID=A0ABD2C8P8_VESSQ